MGVEEVAAIVGRIADGLEECIISCMAAHTGIIEEMIREQLYAGTNGAGEYLYPTYDNDPYFEEPGQWYHQGADYKAWKHEITPPLWTTLLRLPPRPEEVPNLTITGVFYDDINVRRQGNYLLSDPGDRNGRDIVAKYGDCILEMGPTAREYFTDTYLLPAIETFIHDCGYR